MKNSFLIVFLFLFGCTTTSKDQKSANENSESDEISLATEYRPEPSPNLHIESKKDLIGYWVGWFREDVSTAARKKLYENIERVSFANKINISIDRFEGDSVFGHSVVANNNQTFKGTVKFDGGTYQFDVREPGTDLYDGEFRFSIGQEDSVVSGSWASYANIPIYLRKYELTKKVFRYDPAIELDYWFEDEYKNVEKDLVDVLDGESWEELLLNYGYISERIDTMSQDEKKEILDDIVSAEEYMYHYSVTDKFDDFNSSVDTLTSDFVAELSKADIYILRNSIFARHGYSFKKKDLRNYFDNQRWYIPVHADIKADLTEVEKMNIKLLLAYEEHAEEFYDTFGR